MLVDQTKTTQRQHIHLHILSKQFVPLNSCVLRGQTVMNESTSARPCSEKLQRVNHELRIRYASEKSPVQVNLHEKRVQEKAVVVHRLEAALAEVQSKISTVKASTGTALGTFQQ